MSDAPVSMRPRLGPLPPPQPRDRRGAGVAAAIVAVVVVLGLILAVASDATPVEHRGVRVATVKRTTITKTLKEVGVIEAASAVGVSFPVAGTVGTVNVAPGASVTRGQVLATLDTAVLQRAVNTSKAELDQAVATLQNTKVTPITPATPTTKPTGDIDAARDDVLADQQNVDAKLSAAQEKLDSADAICDDATSEVQACRDALNAVLSAQRETARAQAQLVDSSQAFDELVEQLLAGGGGDDVPSSGSGLTVTAADLAAKQKAVDAARIGLAVAQQAVAAAAIVSPIDGTVVDTAVSVGDDVSSPSASPAFRIVGHDGYEVTAIVSVDALPSIKLGQPATVRADGAATELPGEVVAIGAPRSANGSYTYPVSIGLTAPDDLPNGAIAAVAITTAAANDVIAVPTSALRVNGEFSTVTVRDGDASKVVDVEVGVIGTEWTEITKGLRGGERVVLADLSEPLPGAATKPRRGRRR